MKLTDKQIYAVINQIKINFDKEQKIKRDKLYKDSSLIKRSKELAKINKNLPPEIKALTYGTKGEEYFLNVLVNKKHKSNVFNSGELYNKIVLLSIDSKDIEDLKKKLGVKF